MVCHYFNEDHEVSEFLVLQRRFNKFIEERHWGQFHTPKNLSMALAAEVGELLECFQWLTEEQSCSLSEKQLENVADEIADVQLYLLRLAELLEVDIPSAVDQKIIKNEARYPAEKVRGSTKKYTNYD